MGKTKIDLRKLIEARRYIKYVNDSNYDFELYIDDIKLNLDKTELEKFSMSGLDTRDYIFMNYVKKEFEDITNIYNYNEKSGTYKIIKKIENK